MPAIILFDGVCNLCQGFVQFVIQHDPKAHFQFASLQSETGRALMAQHGMLAPVTADPDSVLLLDQGKLYSHSGAVLRIAKQLSGPWALLTAPGWLLPAAVRDALYRFVARNRYRWFGRQQECWLPTPDLKARFLT